MILVSWRELWLPSRPPALCLLFRGHRTLSEEPVRERGRGGGRVWCVPSPHLEFAGESSDLIGRKVRVIAEDNERDFPLATCLVELA